MTEAANNGYCAYSKTGNIVSVVCDYLTVDECVTKILGTLPEGFRPPRDCIGFGYIRGTSSSGQVAVDADGTVAIWCNEKTNTGYFGGNIAFPVAAG